MKQTKIMMIILISIITIMAVFSAGSITASAQVSRKPAHKTILKASSEGVEPAKTRTVKRNQTEQEHAEVKGVSRENDRKRPDTRDITRTAKARETVIEEPVSVAARIIETPESTAYTYAEDSVEAEILRIQNEYRIQAGLSALVPTEELSRAAYIRANECPVCWSHTRPDGSSCFTVSADMYSENLYYGPTNDAAHIVNVLLSSPVHYENIVTADYGACGISVIESGGYWYCAITYGM